MATTGGQSKSEEMKDKGLSAKADKLSYSDKDWIRNSQMQLLKELKKMNRRLAKLEQMKVVETKVVTQVIPEVRPRFRGDRYEGEPPF